MAWGCTNNREWGTIFEHIKVCLHVLSCLTHKWGLYYAGVISCEAENESLSPRTYSGYFHSHIFSSHLLRRCMMVWDRSTEGVCFSSYEWKWHEVIWGHQIQLGAEGAFTVNHSLHNVLFLSRWGVRMPRSPMKLWSVSSSRSQMPAWPSSSCAATMPESCWQPLPGLTPPSSGWPAMAGVHRKASSRETRSLPKEPSHLSWQQILCRNSTATSLA